MVWQPRHRKTSTARIVSIAGNLPNRSIGAWQLSHSGGLRIRWDMAAMMTNESVHNCKDRIPDNYGEAAN
jgi:hypothetical protein